MTYNKALNPVDYKAQADVLASMTPEQRQAYMSGAFEVIGKINAMANGGDLSLAQRLDLDTYFQWLDMGITQEQYNRLKFNSNGEME